MATLKRIREHPREGHHYRMTLDLGNGAKLSQLVVFEQEDTRMFLTGEENYCGFRWFDCVCSDAIFRANNECIGIYLNVHRVLDGDTEDDECILLSKKVSDELLAVLKSL